MLVLQRKKDEAILLGDDIRITVADIGSDWVKLAIDAPKKVSIMRSELVEAAKVNKEAAFFNKGSMDSFKKMISERQEDT